MLIHRDQVNIMNEKLRLIALKAGQNKQLRFTSLMHYLSERNLEKCFHKLKKDKATGVDETTWQEYEKNLKGNIAQLVQRLKTKRYKPQPVRRVYIPKPGKSELRPLGIPSLEDKVVQMALKEILEVIYEQDFLNCSHGFRPGKSCHTAIKQLNNVVMKQPVNWIVEVDIEKFFDTVNHEWLLRALDERIGDSNICWVVRKFLKAAVMEEGRMQATMQGTPQGGVISPLLANIYLHYILDLWMEIAFKRGAKGFVELIRYCDDFVIAIESKQDAKRILPELEERLAKFGLKISKEKTRVLKFGKRVFRQEQQVGKKVETFDFLGFTHYCAKSRKGYPIMMHKTSSKTMTRKLKENNQWLRKVRNVATLKELWPVIKSKIIGHYNYFGINGNIRSLRKYYRNVVKMIYKWINRRSQKKSMNWKQFTNYLQWNELPQPRIYHAILY